MPARASLSALLALALFSAPHSAAAEEDDVPEFRNVAPDNPGGERLGDDDGGDDFTGYPADPGEPSDSYHDVSSEYRAYSPNWTGAYLGVGPLVGYAAIRGEYLEGVDRALAYGAFFNWSSLNQMIDAQFQYTRAQFTPELPASSGGGEANLIRQSLAGNLLLHPLFLAILSGPRGGFTVANTYLLAGAGLEFNRFEPPAGPAVSYNSIGWRIGAGTGTYLDDPSDGGAFWLGIQFQRAYIQGSMAHPEIGRQKLRENMLLIRLTYRRNGNVFTGFGGPDSP
ncbi:MAG: hypothetical protein ACJAYU_004622 [Bradymonadia bacterium]|jgi:hypothetical protein